MKLAILLVTLLGCSNASPDVVAADGATVSTEAGDVPRCDSSITFDSVVAANKTCQFWAETFESSCGKTFEMMTTLGIKVYDFDAAGRLIRDSNVTDTGTRIFCQNAAETCATTRSTCKSVCFKQNHPLGNASCAPGDAG